MSSGSPTTVPSLTTYAEKPIFGLDFIALLKFFLYHSADVHHMWATPNRQVKLYGWHLDAYG